MSERLQLGSRRQLSVQISRTALDKRNEPTIDYERLQQLFYGDLAIPSDRPVTVDMYYGGLFRGYTSLLRRGLMHINVAATEPKSATTAAVIHEGVHVAQAYNNYPRALGHAALRSGATLVALAPLEYNLLQNSSNTPYFWPAVVSGAATAISGTLLYCTTIDPAEKEARKAGADPELLERYRNAIAFPAPDHSC